VIARQQTAKRLRLSELHEDAMICICSYAEDGSVIAKCRLKLARLELHVLGALATDASLGGYGGPLAISRNARVRGQTTCATLPLSRDCNQPLQWFISGMTRRLYATGSMWKSEGAWKKSSLIGRFGALLQGMHTARLHAWLAVQFERHSESSSCPPASY
jgi:hypothetical protein